VSFLAGMGSIPPERCAMSPICPSGNPTAENLLAVIGVLQAKTGVRLHVRALAHAA